MKIGWKQATLLVATVLLNAALLAFAVSSSTQRVSQAFAQSYQDGERCDTPSQCASGFCTQGVCCNEACTATGQSCTVTGAVGTCVNSAQSPVMSLPFQWIAASLVALISILRLRRRAR